MCDVSMNTVVGCETVNVFSTVVSFPAGSENDVFAMFNVCATFCTCASGTVYKFA
jgi:hypothetical protein